MPAKGARCLTWDCPRNLAGPWRARGRGLPDAGQGRGSPGGCAGEVREDVQGRTSGRMPARGPLGGGPGPGVARKYSCNFLKVLQRVRASGRRRHGASPRPPAPPWTRSRRPRAGHGVSRAARSSPATARCGGPRTRDIHSSARSRPHGKNDQATIKTREATMRCAATPCYRHGRRRRAPGAGPPAGAGQHQAQLTRPPPANHRVGRRQGRQAQAPTGPPRTPGPAASRRRPDRRTPRRPN